MFTLNRRRVVSLSLALCAISTLPACAPKSGPVDIDARAAYPLLVNNRSTFEVVVYSMAAPGSRGMRLGTARAMDKTVLKVPVHAMQSNEVLAVQLHAIGAVGSTPNWTSTSVTMNPQFMAELDIRADRAGDLRMSNLSARLASTIR